MSFPTTSISFPKVFTALAIAAVLLFGAYSIFKKEDDLLSLNYSFAPPNAMNKQSVLDMITNYYENQYKAINDPTSPNKVNFPAATPEDSRAVYFNLDTLKKLIYYIEKASADFTDAEKKQLGVNVYFASYPDKAETIHNGYSYTNRHTLVFVPTIFDPTLGRAKDIDAFANLNGDSTSPRYISDTKFFTPGSTGYNPMLFCLGAPPTPSSSTPGTMISQNNGTTIPPPPRSTNTGNVILDMTDPN